MDDGRVTVDQVFHPSGKYPGLTTDELYWISGVGYFSMMLFKDGEACRSKSGSMVYVASRHHMPIRDYIPEMREKEIRWMMGEL